MLYFLNTMPGWLQTLIHADQDLFMLLNTVLTNNWLDNILPWWRDANTWIPLYVFLLVFMIINFGWRSVGWIIFLIATASLTDLVSSWFFKDYFMRVRPCNDPFLATQARLLINRCPSSFSFTSSHATNHFGAAMFIFVTLKPFIGKWGWLFFAWAATICYGQVYVGVHYPLDVLAGGLLGCFLGWLMSKIYDAIHTKGLSLHAALKTPEIPS